MASVTVDVNAIVTRSDRVVVRTTTGVIYACVVGTGNIRMHKGNAQPPTSFTEQDAGNAPDDSNFQRASIAIDSNDIIHVVWWDNDTMTAGGARYQKFNTVDAASNPDTWDSGGNELTSITLTKGPIIQGTSIALDTNDIPHIGVIDAVANMGNKDTLYYANKIGGSWNTKVEIEGQANEVNVSLPSITFAKDSGGTIVPQLAFIQATASDAIAALGNVLNATSFTNFVIDATADSTITQQFPSIACDSARDNTYVAYTDETTQDLQIIKHINTNAWTSWETIETVDSTSNWRIPSLAINGTNRYIVAEDEDTNDLHLWLDEGSGWTDNGAFEAASDSNAKVKWSTYVNNEGSVQIDFLFHRGAGVKWNEHTLGAAPAAALPHPSIVNSSAMIALGTAIIVGLSTLKSWLFG